MRTYTLPTIAMLVGLFTTSLALAETWEEFVNAHPEYEREYRDMFGEIQENIGTTTGTICAATRMLPVRWSRTRVIWMPTRKWVSRSIKTAVG